jgi:hypothetical protein
VIDLGLAPAEFGRVLRLTPKLGQFGQPLEGPGRRRIDPEPSLQGLALGRHVTPPVAEPGAGRHPSGRVQVTRA